MTSPKSALDSFPKRECLRLKVFRVLSVVRHSVMGGEMMEEVRACLTDRDDGPHRKSEHKG